MSVKAEKAEQRIETLCSSCGLSEMGKQWISKTMDPFKDMPEKGVGYPDMYGGLSVIQEFNFKQTFIAPASAGGNEWDFHAFFPGCDFSGTLSVANLVSGNIFFSNNTTTYLHGGLEVRSGAAGANLLIATQDALMANLAIPSASFVGGRARVVSKAFEIHNVTSQMFKQGDLTVWRHDQPPGSPGILNYSNNTDNTTCYQTAVPCLYQAEVPFTAARTLYFPNSQTWEAKEGCYVVAVMANQSSPPRFLSSAQAVATMFSENGSNYITTGTIPASSHVVSITTPSMWSPFIPCGAFLTGLSTETALTVNVKYVVEYFPEASSPTMMSMAKPSSHFDPRALSMYSESSWRLPPGTPVRNNGAGEWISTVADVLKDFGVPGMGMVGSIGRWLEKPSTKMLKNALIGAEDRQVSTNPWRNPKQRGVTSRSNQPIGPKKTAPKKNPAKSINLNGLSDKQKKNIQMMLSKGANMENIRNTVKGYRNQNSVRSRSEPPRSRSKARK